MKIMKRVIVALVAVAIAVTTMLACGNRGGTGNGLVTLEVYSQRANFEGIQGGWFAGIMKEKFGVQLNIIKENDNTYTARMESGNLGDIIIWGSDGENYKAAVEAGLLLDWNAGDLLQTEGKYMYDNLQLALDKNAKISGDNGIVYGIGDGIGQSTYHDSFMYSWDLRYDYFAELGCPEVKNLDDLFNVFVEMKKNHPTDDEGKETYAISIWPEWDGYMVMYPKSLASAYYGIDEFALGYYDFENHVFIDPLKINDDGSYGPYLEMLQFFNKLYQNGLLDPDSDIQTFDQASAKIKSGRTFWSIFDYAGSAQFNTKDNIGAGKAMYCVIPEDAKPVVYSLNPLGGSNVWSIGAKTKYPELCMQIINYFATPVGNLEQQYGPQGLCWDYVDGKTVFTDLGALTHLDNETVMESDDPQYAAYCGDSFKNGQQQLNNIIWSLNALNPETGEKYNYKYWESESEPPAEGSIEDQWRKNNNAVNTDDYLDQRGKFVISQKYSYSNGVQDADLKVVWNQVTKAITTGSWLAIEASTDEEFEAAINQMIKDAKSYDSGTGYDQCVEWSENQAAILTQIIEEAEAVK